MAQIKQAALDYELKRWMRSDWRRFWRHGQDDDPLFSLCERMERKYSPDQPRVPAGVPEGGQWTGEGGSSSSPTSNISENPVSSTAKPLAKLAARISPEREEECELIRRKDEFVCKAFQSRACYAQAMLRYANCLQGLPLPPLNF